jgi:dolichol-phosphate mannosyltransferase
MARIDLIIPVYNEGPKVQGNLEKIAESISHIPDIRFSFIVVDDGSSDQTHNYLQRFLESKPDSQLICLTRNFGKEGALLAGLEQSGGQAVLVMDSDLQHPPELIAKMVNAWQQGLDVVEGYKSSRGKESLGKRFLADTFYSVFEFLAGKNLRNHSDFKLLDRRVVDTYLALPERKRFFRGLIPWMGFAFAQIPFDVPERDNGQSRWSLLKLFRLSVDALTSFTSAPLYLINIMGLICLLLSLVIGGITLYYKFVGVAVSGFTTVILLISLIGSFIMFGLGLIGMYIGQIFAEVKKRPLYIVDERKSKLKKTISAE